MIVAIDGPSSSGKGTITKLLAEKLGFDYLFTGNIFRFIALKLGVILDNQELLLMEIESIAEQVTLHNLLDDRLVDDRLGVAASKIAVLPQVRQAVLKIEHKIINASKNIIVEGRDIATCVCPNAEFKFFFTASVEERAKRRFNQLQKMGNGSIYNDVLLDLQQRDLRDTSREHNPLRVADGAVVIDTTSKNPQQVVNEMLLVMQK